MLPRAEFKGELPVIVNHFTIYKSMSVIYIEDLFLLSLIKFEHAVKNDTVEI